MKKVKQDLSLIVLVKYLMTSAAMIFLSSGIQAQNTYSEVKIGNQVWMSENLNVDQFRNGDKILEAQTDEEWNQAINSKQPAWCYYEGKSENGEKYGKLYNWYAVSDPRGLAPNGWRITNNDDWVTLRKYLGGASIAGKKMKSTDHWNTVNGRNSNGTNESGFNALPGGYRGFGGTFWDLGNGAAWWMDSSGYGLFKEVFYYAIGTDDKLGSDDINRGYGVAVRCLKE